MSLMDDYSRQLADLLDRRPLAPSFAEAMEAERIHDEALVEQSIRDAEDLFALAEVLPAQPLVRSRL